MTNKGTSRIAKNKVYFQRASSYISIINFGLILATYKTVNQINISDYVLFPLMIFLVIGIGFIDYKYIYKKEFAYMNKQNDIKEQLNNIEILLKQIK